MESMNSAHSAAGPTSSIGSAPPLRGDGLALRLSVIVSTRAEESGFHSCVGDRGATAPATLWL